MSPHRPDQPSRLDVPAGILTAAQAWVDLVSVAGAVVTVGDRAFPHEIPTGIQLGTSDVLPALERLGVAVATGQVDQILHAAVRLSEAVEATPDELARQHAITDTPEVFSFLGVLIMLRAALFQAGTMIYPQPGQPSPTLPDMTHAATFAATARLQDQLADNVDVLLTAARQLQPDVHDLITTTALTAAYPHALAALEAATGGFLDTIEAAARALSDTINLVRVVDQIRLPATPAVLGFGGAVLTMRSTLRQLDQIRDQAAGNDPAA